MAAEADCRAGAAAAALAGAGQYTSVKYTALPAGVG